MDEVTDMFVKPIHIRDLRLNGSSEIHLKHPNTNQLLTIEVFFDTNYTFGFDRAAIVENSNANIADYINQHALLNDDGHIPLSFYFVAMKVNTNREKTFYESEIIKVNITYDLDKLKADEIEVDEQFQEFITSFTDYVSEYFN